MNLIKIRKKSKFTQVDIAKLVGISDGYYSMIETGKRIPSVKVAKKIATVLNIPWEDIFNNIDTDFSIKLKKQRQLKELSVDDICTLTQINKERYIAIENGLEPTTDELILLKTILNFNGTVP